MNQESNPAHLRYNDSELARIAQRVHDAHGPRPCLVCGVPGYYSQLANSRQWRCVTTLKALLTVIHDAEGHIDRDRAVISAWNSAD